MSVYREQSCQVRSSLTVGAISFCIFELSYLIKCIRENAFACSFALQSQQDCYRFNTNPRGVCVIIDCVGNDGGETQNTFGPTAQWWQK